MAVACTLSVSFRGEIKLNRLQIIAFQIFRNNGKGTKSDPEPRNHRFIPSVPLWQDQPVCVYMLDIECFHKAKHKASKDYNPFDILEDIQYTSHLQCLFHVLTDESPSDNGMDCVWFEGKTPQRLFWRR